MTIERQIINNLMNRTYALTAAEAMHGICDQISARRALDKLVAGRVIIANKMSIGQHSNRMYVYNHNRTLKPTLTVVSP